MIMVSETNFDRLELLRREIQDHGFEQIYEDVAGFESLRKI